jgi:hypothetical protein
MRPCPTQLRLRVQICLKRTRKCLGQSRMRTWSESPGGGCPDSDREQTELSAHYAGGISRSFPQFLAEGTGIGLAPQIRWCFGRCLPKRDADRALGNGYFQPTLIRGFCDEEATANWNRGPDPCGMRDSRAQSQCRCRSINRRQCAATGHRREFARRSAALGSSSWATSTGRSVSLSLLSDERRVYECQYRKLLLLEWRHLASSYDTPLHREARYERLRHP